MHIKNVKILLVLMLVSGCHLREDSYINADGSGIIEAEAIRDEGTFMRYESDEYLTKEEFVDSTYVVREVIEKQREIFDRFLPEHQALLKNYENVKVHIKRDSYTKEYRKAVSRRFKNIDEVEDLSNVLDYVDDLQNNYPMNPGGKKTHLSYFFDGVTFRRNFKVLNQANYDKYKPTIEEAKGFFDITNFSHTAYYHFPRKIKSVSNPDAIVSADRKSLELKQSLLECLENPDRAFLEVILED